MRKFRAARAAYAANPPPAAAPEPEGLAKCPMGFSGAAAGGEKLRCPMGFTAESGAQLPPGHPKVALPAGHPTVPAGVTRCPMGFGAEEKK